MRYSTAESLLCTVTQAHRSWPSRTVECSTQAMATSKELDDGQARVIGGRVEAADDENVEVVVERWNIGRLTSPLSTAKALLFFSGLLACCTSPYYGRV